MIDAKFSVRLYTADVLRDILISNGLLNYLDMGWIYLLY